MRPIISMVPSWTETLIAAGLRVVGRTRFCIHPEDSVRGVASFGGTKTLASDAAEKLERVFAVAGRLRPIVVLDREENPKDFFDFFSNFRSASGGRCETVVTHVQNIQSLSQGLRTIAAAVGTVTDGDSRGSNKLLEFAGRAECVFEASKAPLAEDATSQSLGAAVIRLAENSDSAIATPDPSFHQLDRLILETDAPILYVIWRDPWMVVGSDTWIGQTLKLRFSQAKFPIDSKRLFSGRASTSGENRYPTIDENEVPRGAIVLFSSEPYPFGRSWDDLLTQPLAKAARTVALVDGERLSWFGLRAIRFLEEG